MQSQRRTSLRLAPHELTLRRQEGTVTQVVATVRCERKASELAMEGCLHCDRYSHIVAHETGYTLWCYSKETDS